MSSNDDKRKRDYPGDRFSERIIEQDLGELIDQLKDEPDDFDDGHLEQGRNQIELYRQGSTTVSLIILQSDAELPEHSVADGSTMVQVLSGSIKLRTDDGVLDREKGTVTTLQQGITHAVEAQEPTALLLTIMRG